MLYISKFGNKRHRRERKDFYRNILSIVNIGTAHTKEAKPEMQKLYEEYRDEDTSYRSAKFDKAALENLARMRGG